MGLFKKNVTVTKSLAMNGKDTGAIVGIKGELLGRIVRLEGDAEIIIGSDCNVAGIVINHGNVEGRHCSVRYIQGEKMYEVINLGDGELIADLEQSIEKGNSYKLQPGTRIHIGNQENEIRLG